MPGRRTTPSGYSHARQLRKSPTIAEAKLWARLRANQLHGINFRRQHAIGRFVVDFCSPKHQLIIELDGSPHLTTTRRDQDRTAALEAQGYRVLRFWNDQVLHDMEGVARAILKAVESS